VSRGGRRLRGVRHALAARVSSSWSWSPLPTAGSPPARRPARTAAPTAHDYHPAALGQRLGRMLGLVAPHHHAVERRLAITPALAITDPSRHRHPERRPGGAAGAAVELGVVGEVAASEMLVAAMVLPPSDAWPGGAARPLGTGERWTPWHAARSPGASRGANEAGPAQSGCRAGSDQVPAWLVEGLRLVDEHATTARADPSTLGAVGVGGSRREGRLRPVRDR
jgi:hypothetical protein